MVHFYNFWKSVTLVLFLFICGIRHLQAYSYKLIREENLVFQTINKNTTWGSLVTVISRRLRAEPIFFHITSYGNIEWKLLKGFIHESALAAIIACGAIDQILFTEGDELSCFLKVLSFQWSSCAESPARTALAWNNWQRAQSVLRRKCEK